MAGNRIPLIFFLLYKIERKMVLMKLSIQMRDDLVYQFCVSFFFLLRSFCFVAFVYSQGLFLSLLTLKPT